MIVFIDESGDPGVDVKKGASPYLVFSMVIFEKESDIAEVQAKISKYRQKIAYSSSYEFKFRKSRKKIIIEFLNSVKSCNFRIMSLIVDKRDLKFSKKVSSKEIYKFLLSLLLDRCLTKKENVRIRLDGKAERELQASIRSFIKKSLRAKGKNVKLDFKIISSKNDDIVQLTDIIVGSVARSYMKNRKDFAIYKKIIEKQIELEWTLNKGDLEPILK